MKKLLFTSLLSTIAVIGFWSTANSCGDKFLVIGRGVRYERAYAAIHPGSILFYTSHNNADIKVDTDLQNVLVKAGHKVQTVNDTANLDSTLKTGKFDLVLINLNDAANLEQQIVGSPSNPAVLPIIYDRTGKEVATAGKDYQCILKAAGKNTQILQVVDEAMGEKLSGAPVKCKWSK